MTTENLISKVQKLLRLATSNNANEAAMAAAKAQELIDQHNLSAALLALDNAEPTKGLDDEPIIDFQKAGAPLDTPKMRDRWRTTLASTLARWNGCSIYLSGPNIALVGRPSDAETVRYLYAYLTREVEKLTTEIGQGMGRTWRNNFRLGVVDTIATKIAEQHRKFEHDVRATARAEGSTALMRVDRALATIDERRDAVKAFVKANLKLRSGSRYGGRADASARDLGRRAGQSISVGGSRAAIVSAAKGLKS